MLMFICQSLVSLFSLLILSVHSSVRPLSLIASEKLVFAGTLGKLHNAATTWPAAHRAARLAPAGLQVSQKDTTPLIMRTNWTNCPFSWPFPAYVCSVGQSFAAGAANLHANVIFKHNSLTSKNLQRCSRRSRTFTYSETTQLNTGSVFMLWTCTKGL